MFKVGDERKNVTQLQNGKATNLIVCPIDDMQN